MDDVNEGDSVWLRYYFIETDVFEYTLNRLTVESLPAHMDEMMIIRHLGLFIQVDPRWIASQVGQEDSI